MDVDLTLIRKMGKHIFGILILLIMLISKLNLIIICKYFIYIFYLININNLICELNVDEYKKFDFFF